MTVLAEKGTSASSDVFQLGAVSVPCPWEKPPAPPQPHVGPDAPVGPKTEPVDPKVIPVEPSVGPAMKTTPVGFLPILLALPPLPVHLSNNATCAYYCAASNCSLGGLTADAECFCGASTGDRVLRSPQPVFSPAPKLPSRKVTSRDRSQMADVFAVHCEGDGNHSGGFTPVHFNNVTFFVNDPVNITLAACYLMIMIASMFQMMIIFYSRHDKASYQLLFLVSVMMWFTFRSVLWIKSLWSSYWSPRTILFLLRSPTFFVFLSHSSLCVFMGTIIWWRRKRVVRLLTWLFVFLNVAVLALTLLVSLGMKMEKVADKITLNVLGLSNLVVAVALGLFTWRFRQLSRSELSVSLLPRTPLTITIINSLLAFLLFSRAIFDFLNSAGKIHDEHLARVGINGPHQPNTWTLFVVFFIWEVLPGMLLLLLVWKSATRRIKRLGGTPMSYNTLEGGGGGGGYDSESTPVWEREDGATSGNVRRENGRTIKRGLSSEGKVPGGGARGGGADSTGNSYRRYGSSSLRNKSDPDFEQSIFVNPNRYNTPTDGPMFMSNSGNFHPGSSNANTLSPYEILHGKASQWGSIGTSVTGSYVSAGENSVHGGQNLRYSSIKESAEEAQFGNYMPPSSEIDDDLAQLGF